MPGIGTSKAEARTVLGDGAVELGYDGKSVKAEELPDDTAVDLEYLGADGEPIPTGTQGVQERDEVKVPDGAFVVVISGPSNVTSGCIGCSAALQSPVGDRPLGKFNTHFQERRIHLETLVPDVDGSSALGNVVLRADARVPLQYSTLDVYGLVRPILEGGAGVGVPIDPTGDSVDVRLFQRIHVDPLAIT